MGLQFPSGKTAYYDAANFLDNVPSFSAAGWVKFDTVTSANKQYLWSHANARQVSIRKASSGDGATDKLRFSLTNQETFKTATTSTLVTAGTAYHVAVTWTKNNASGMKIYLNNTLEATTSTTAQTSDYESGGNADLVFGGQTTSSNPLVGVLEGWAFWPGTILSAAQIGLLYRGGWPHLALGTKPAVFYEMRGLATRIPDRSGMGRHIEAATMSTGLADVGTIGRWYAPTWPHSQPRRVSGAAPPASGTWTKFGEVLHPVATIDVTGLMNGTSYDFKIIAVDAGGNSSQDSNIVTETPAEPAPPVSVLNISPWRRSRNFSKYRPSQNG